jgi:4-aminobutyrate aminotransferase/(S)-3-amino-2-methylpropionate transaminase
MWGIELVRDRETRTPAREETAALTRACWERGLVTITAGTYGNVVRTLMPLVISDDELEEGLGVLEAALTAVCGRAA